MREDLGRMVGTIPTLDPYSRLVPDDQLSLLPPLPETPRVDSSRSRLYTADSGRVDMTAFFASMEPDYTPPDAVDDLIPAAPERQQRSSPIKRSDSSTVFADRTLARTPHARHIMTPPTVDNVESEMQSNQASQRGLGLGRPVAVEERTVSGGMKRSGSLHGMSEYPVFSTRQGGMNTPRNISAVKPLVPPSDSTVEPLPSNEISPNKRSARRSPAKQVRPAVQDMFSPRRRPVDPASIPLPETPAFPKQQLVPDSHTSVVSVASTSRNISGSFMLPASTGDASMIGNCRPPTSLGFDREEDSFDFDIEQIRPLTNRKARLGRKEEDEVREEMLVSPSKPSVALPAMRRLDESTLLPSSPRPDLLKSTHAISRVAPPWADHALAPTSSSTTVTDPTETEPKTKAATVRRSPRKAPQPTSRTKRTFPASSSDQSLATVGEHDFLQVPSSALDKSTILPVSPAKQAHLLDPEHLLLDEGMSFVANEEGHTFYIPLRPSAEDVPPVPQIPSTLVVTSSRTPRKRASPLKTAASRDAVWDKTLDLKELMANAKKPKRASGTEESFADLLNGEHELDGMNDFDPDETFLPSTLRPVARSRSSHALQAGTPSPQKSSRVLDSVRKSRRRSKSLSEADPMPTATAADIPYTKRKTPAKMPPPPAPTVARPRQSMLLPTAASRRVSLSAGAVTTVTSASIKRLNLPTTRTVTSRTAAAPRASVAPPATTTLSKRTSLAPVPAARRTSTLPSSNATAPRPRTGSATTTSTVPARASFQPRSKSISETVTTSASQPRLAPTVRATTTTTTSQLASRATTSGARSVQAGPSSSATTSLARPSVRVGALPQPARDGSARSAITRPTITTSTTISRPFGTEAGRTINRPSRTSALPTAPSASSAAARSGLGSKLSAGPVVSPSKREAASGTLAKVRSLSTPASSLARTTAARAGGMGGGSGLPAKKSSVPPERTTGLSRTTTGLPRTTTTASRLPAGAPSSARTGTLTRGGPNTTAGATGSTRAIADIRAKLSQLEKRTTLARR